LGYDDDHILRERHLVVVTDDRATDLVHPALLCPVEVIPTPGTPAPGSKSEIRNPKSEIPTGGAA
jgi:hypothetical protein